MKKDTVGFLTTAGFAEEFFSRCIRKEAVTEQERLSILEEMIQEQKVLELSNNELGSAMKDKNILHIKAPNRSRKNA